MTKKLFKNLSSNSQKLFYLFITFILLAILTFQPFILSAKAASNSDVAKLRIFSYDASDSTSSSSLQTQSLYTAEEMQRQDELFFYYCENDYKEDYLITEEVAFEDNAFSTNNSSSSSLGHAFIVVTNLTTTNLTVGLMTVAPGESVSIGTYPDDSSFGSNSSYDRGIWYNREMYGNNGGVCGTYGNATSIDTYLTQAELNSLNSFVKDSSNDAWDLFNNCSRFAARAWNVVGEFELSAGWPCTPSYLVGNIRKHSGYKTYDPLGSYNGRRAYVKNGALIYE